jgi:hypothetical protein
MSAIVRDIETQTRRPLLPLLALTQICLCIAPAAASPQALEIVEQLLQAHPAGTIRNGNTTYH